MNIVIFTPAYVHSAIGRSTSLISQELIKHGNHVTIVQTEDREFIGKNSHDFGVQPIPWDNFSIVASQIKNADSCIYEIGDHYPFHKGALTWLKFKPGIICLHDFDLSNLFYEWARLNPYEAVAEYNFFDIDSDDFKKQFIRSKNNERQIEYVQNLDLKFPSVEWICKKGVGVITHSSSHIKKVLSSCAGPVFVVPLAYNLLNLVENPLPQKITEEKQSLNLLTIGHMNPNKRILQVIEAISSSPLAKERFIYHLVGLIETVTKLEILAYAQKKGATLVIHDEVSDTDLAHCINDADLVSCLRWPSREAASASCIEAMLSGVPVLVTNTAFYKEIPDELVIKIDPNYEIESLKLALESFIQNPQKFQTIAQKAKLWAQETFTATNYVTHLKLMIEDVKTNAPIVQALNLLKVDLKTWSSDGYVSSVINNLPNLEIFEFN